MGGRGASSSISDYGNRYGTRYHLLPFAFDNRVGAYNFQGYMIFPDTYDGKPTWHKPILHHKQIDGSSFGPHEYRWFVLRVSSNSDLRFCGWKDRWMNHLPFETSTLEPSVGGVGDAESLSVGKYVLDGLVSVREKEVKHSIIGLKAFFLIPEADVKDVS